MLLFQLEFDLHLTHLVINIAESGHEFNCCKCSYNIFITLINSLCALKDLIRGPFCCGCFIICLQFFCVILRIIKSLYQQFVFCHATLAPSGRLCNFRARGIQV